MPQDRPMTVKKAAVKYEQPPRKLLDALRKRFPESEWTLDSELPADFAEMVDHYANEYLETTEVHELPKGEITSTVQAVQENALILEALEYGVLETIAQVRREDVIYQAQADAVSDIQAYGTAYTDTWVTYYRSEVAKRNKRVEGIGKKLESDMIARNQALGKMQGELVVEKLNTDLRQTARRTDMDLITNALHSSQTKETQI